MTENKKESADIVTSLITELSGPAGRLTHDEISELKIRTAHLTSLIQGWVGLAVLLAVAAVVVFALALATATEYSEPDYIPAGMLFAFSISCGAVAWFFADRKAIYKARVGGLEQWLKVPSEEGEKSQYFGQLVEINVTNLRRYYSLVERHTGRSFGAAIGAGVVGFLLILAGLVGGVVAKSADLSLSYIATGAGVLSEFIASVFFYLYNRTVRQLKDYHESLVRVQNVLLALKLASDARGSPDVDSLTADVVKALLSQGRGGGAST